MLLVNDCTRTNLVSALNMVHGSYSELVNGFHLY